MDQSNSRLSREETVEHINWAQDFGFATFVRSWSSLSEVVIRPGESAELCVRNLEAMTDCPEGDFTLSLKPTKGCIQVFPNLISGVGEFSPSEFEQFFEQYPLEQVGSLKALAQLLDEHFGSGSDWRVYTCFMRALPCEISDALVDRFVVPLLARGELGPALDDVEHYLLDRGWSHERIRNSYDASERVERSARHYFFYLSGVPVSEVKNSDQLTRAIENNWRGKGNEAAVRLIVMYIQAHLSQENVSHLPATLEPLVNRFGPKGHKEITNAYWCCKHTDPFVPAYDGEISPLYGEPFTEKRS
jgi:hypothetical protein